MKPEEVEIRGEYLALIEIPPGVDPVLFRDWLIAEVSRQGAKVKSWGTEQQMRLAMIDRAELIAKKNNTQFAIKDVQYDQKTATLTLTFPNGEVRIYDGFPEPEYYALIHSNRDNYYKKFIEGRYQYR